MNTNSNSNSNSNSNEANLRLKAAIEAKKAAKLALAEAETVTLHLGAKTVSAKALEEEGLTGLTTSQLPLHQGLDGRTYNKEQTEAIQAALAGNSFCFIGAAGTGKTAAIAELSRQLVYHNKVPLIKESTRVLVQDSPGVVCISYTNVAVNNIAKNMQGVVTCSTINALLEFAPVFYEVIDASGNLSTTMRFEPRRHRHNPLPRELTTIIVEEAGSVGTELFKLLLDALPSPEAVQFIFLGDLYQVPPIYDDAILGYKMLDIPVIELQQVYRQALNSPIISLAHRVKDGKQLCEAELRSPAWNVTVPEGKLSIKPWKKKLDSFVATKAACQFVIQAIEAKEFDPEQDMILIPFNKHFGTIEVNKYLSQYLGTQRGAIIHEVIAGFNKHYLAVGDKVFVNKRFGTITSITKNGSYLGKRPQKATITLNRWGHETSVSLANMLETSDPIDIDKLLAAMSDVDDRKLQSSHFVEVAYASSGQVEVLTTSSELNALIFSYALTVHKAQGSEWRKVYAIFHSSHNVMMCNEILYTAITRAREELLVICEPNHFQKAVVTRRIKGTTLTEKAEYFKGKRAKKAVEEAEEAEAVEAVES